MSLYLVNVDQTSKYKKPTRRLNMYAEQINIPTLNDLNLYSGFGNEWESFYEAANNVELQEYEGFFLESHLELASSDLELFLEATKAMGYTTAYRDFIYTKIEERFKSDRNTERELMKIITKYMDMNSTLLKSVDFSRQLQFSQALKDKVNGMFGVNEKLVIEAAKASDFIDHKWKVSTIPIYSTLLSVMIHYLIHNPKNEKIIKLVCYFLAMPMFSSACYKSFPNGVNQEVMDYTIANLSNKFKIKTEGSILGMIVFTCNTILASYREDLKLLDDKESYHKFLTGLKTRISKNVQYIAEAYYKNYDEGNYLNTDSDDLDEDSYRIISSDTLKVAGLARKVVMNIATVGYDEVIVNRAKNLSQYVNLKKLQGFLDTIASDHKEELNEFIVRSIELLYIKGYTIDDAKLPLFLPLAVEAYRSNSDDPTIVYIKETLEKWIDIQSSTKHNYKRSVFYTFIMTIQKEAKGGDY